MLQQTLIVYVLVVSRSAQSNCVEPLKFVVTRLLRHRPWQPTVGVIAP